LRNREPILGFKASGWLQRDHLTCLCFDGSARDMSSERGGFGLSGAALHNKPLVYKKPAPVRKTLTTDLPKK